MSKKKRLSAADLKGLTNILKDATLHITNLAEELNKQIVHPPFLKSTPFQHLITGIASITYKNVRGITKLVGFGLEKMLTKLEPIFDSKEIPFEHKGLLVAILNGVVGDYLKAKENPLATSMHLTYKGGDLDLNAAAIQDAYPNINGKILLMVHGLCLNDVWWEWKDHDHGAALAEDLGLMPVYVQYNTGLHISTNGQEFSKKIEDLLNAWPVPVEELTIVAHSMGGLVSRSAYHYGNKEGKSWTKKLSKMIFLGSPHQGAPLERMGNLVDQILEAVPYAKPFARLGKIRSSGITDLRYGTLVDEDWKDIDRFQKQEKERTNIPLPKDVACYTIAATMGVKDAELNLLGDGLVQLKSALGKDENPKKNLNFKASNTYIAYEANHMDLLNSPEVYEQLKKWLMD